MAEATGTALGHAFTAGLKEEDDLLFPAGAPQLEKTMADLHGAWDRLVPTSMALPPTRWGCGMLEEGTGPASLQVVGPVGSNGDSNSVRTGVPGCRGCGPTLFATGLGFRIGGGFRGSTTSVGRNHVR